MWRFARFIVLASLVVWADALLAQVVGTESTKALDEKIALGRQIYREGLLPGNRPLRGMAQAGVVRSGADAACMACHRRSGYGASEGTLEIRSITGPALFSRLEVRPIASDAETQGAIRRLARTSGETPVTAKSIRDIRIDALYGARQRPPYDDATLRRAIVEGVDVAGRQMNAGMPRYSLSGDEFAALLAYLKTLSAQVAPGVTDDAVHFATVIQPGVDATRRAALIGVLQAYIDDRNAGMRAETRRHLSGSVRLGRTYREWILHVWDLTGRSEDWGAQLDAYNRQQPVFALVSGLGQASWKPIHAFSERFEIPCIFPQTDLPVVDAPGVYTVYLSRGVELEAAALAKYLHETDPQARVMQVFRREGASHVAAAAFKKAWDGSAHQPLAERVLDGTADAAFWTETGKQAASSTLVLWLSSDDVTPAPAILANAASLKELYLSSTLQGGRLWDGQVGAGRAARLVFPYDTPDARAQRLQTVKLWLHNKGIVLVDEIVQMNAYLAAVVTAGEVSHAMDSFSRELLLERVEHRVGNALDPTVYPHLSLGPGQRFASKGSYIVESTGASLRAISPWLVP